MNTALSLHLLALSPAVSIPNPTPAPPPGDVTAVATTVMSWVMWGALIVCALVALASGGFMAAGKMSNRPHVQERGMNSLLWALAGVVSVGIAIPLVNNFASIA